MKKIMVSRKKVRRCFYCEDIKRERLIIEKDIDDALTPSMCTSMVNELEEVMHLYGYDNEPQNFKYMFMVKFIYKSGYVYGMEDALLENRERYNKLFGIKTATAKLLKP